ncbi:MAG TPA: acyltransferase family protein, partial [Xylella taiwanensis]
MLRIWPALIVVTSVTTLFLGPIVSTEPINHYFINPKTWDYFRILKLIIRYELPGVFVTNPFPNAVNGSLWTIPIEFRWYLILMALGMVGLLRNRLLLLIAVIALAVFVFVIKDAQNNQDWKLHLQLGVFFCYGIYLYYFRSFFTAHTASILLALGIVSGLLFSIDQKYTALFLLLPALVIRFGIAATPFIRHAGRYGDISYGVYLYAFPVQQTIIFLFKDHLIMWSALALSTAVTVIFALLSWHLVESPALQLKKRYFVKSKDIQPRHEA